MDLFTIKKCFCCPNRVVDLDRLETKLRLVINQHRFNGRQGARVDSPRPMHHQMFHIALAGCPNACSQPQIKDFGIVGQAVPAVNGACNGCGSCAGVCPEAAISIDGGKAVINRDKCMNCGLCTRHCPTEVMQISAAGIRVLAGGKLGRHPRLASELLPLAEEKETAEILGRCLDLYLEKAGTGERFGALLERLGTDRVINQLRRKNFHAVDNLTDTKDFQKNGGKYYK